VYLKSLEMVGFKSFADTTKLEFQPGMTAIVGPNGCGKSNIADSIRWVLGEQSAKAMRATKMEDCIFNGTDTRKPLGMAEVAITFADCEQSLGLEFNEMTITRRVFRSGEGQYFMNKIPCRLKDIQRLFLGTGIGTTSYSLMEQGQIDRVLSSHPEDRRTIFEEASGITKFKADKKEAIRKLEYTEANLLRLADVIREVKRQIGSLQRQAGKARRFKELREELRKFDVHVSKYKLTMMDQEISRLQAESATYNEQIQAYRTEIAEMDQGNAVLRKSILQTEHEIGSIMEKGMEARSKLDHTQEMIRMNQQQIDEYVALSKRDTDDLEKTRRQIEEQKQSTSELSAQIENARSGLAAAEKERKESNDAFASHQHEVEAMRNSIQELRTESVELESLVSKLQNQLTQMESQEHSDAIRRERLFAEQAQLESVVKRYERRQAEMQQDLEAARNTVSSGLKNLEQSLVRESDAKKETARLHQAISDARSQALVLEAQLELMAGKGDDTGNLPPGSQVLLDKSNPLKLDADSVLGLLGPQLTIEDGYATAVKAVLKFWLDAVLVRNRSAALNILRVLETQKSGTARLLILDTPSNDNQPQIEIPAGSSRLSDHVKASTEIMPLVWRMLGNAIIVDSLDLAPAVIGQNAVYVTRTGSFIRGEGYVEYRLHEQHADTSPQAGDLTQLRAKLQETQARISQLEKEMGVLSEHETQSISTISSARQNLESTQHDLAVKEGEFKIVSAETDQARDRLNTVTWELNSLVTSENAGPSKRSAISAEIEESQAKRANILKQIEPNTRQLQDLENKQSDLQGDVTRKSIRFAQISQDVEHLGIRHSSVQKHLQELETLLKDRSEGLVSHQRHIEQLKSSITAGEKQLVSLREIVEANSSTADSLRKNMEKQSQELDQLEDSVGKKKAMLDNVRNTLSNLNIKLTETTMKRQNQVDRITSEYNMTESQLMEQPEPAWEGEKPSNDAMETTIAELKTKIEAMGPVNLVAIEEYQELEERHTFLTQQEQDLVNSKQQLMDMIKKINQTTSEMFSSTFAAINENFQAMFKKLFNGGSAKLVLVNEEDVLECGIEIIARPPGKRLQNISLLSGGERTLTAVALLFSIYMIKPSPFCLLDELDAPLDESNIGRFVSILQGFLEQSQFVVITHNRQTMSAGSVLYGITMPEKGVSKIISMKFNEHKKRLFEAPAPIAPAPVS